MSKITCHEVFRNAMAKRKTDYPFGRISAHKVRESHENLLYEQKVVRSIAGYLRTSPGYYGRSNILVGCTTEDKAHRLKRVPEIIAHEVGYNLHPAVEALTLHGVPDVAVRALLASIKPQVDLLLFDCDVAQQATARQEYGAMKAGNSGMKRICADAVHIAEQAIEFCAKHGTL
jgi:hypothetical protein